MDHNKLYNSIKTSLSTKLQGNTNDSIDLPFADLTLILKDNKYEITINVHKIILYCVCNYFEKLLTSCREKNETVIIIIVPNAYVSYDIIMRFYNKEKVNAMNYPEWKYQLESYKCHDFFGLEFLDTKILFNLEIPVEGIELLLDVIELIGYNDSTVKLLNKNIPKEYDLSKFSKELLDEMYRVGKTYDVISGFWYHNMKIWNDETLKLIDTLNRYRIYPNSICHSFDSLQIASRDNEHIKIWDAKTDKLISTLDDFNTMGILFLCYSPDNKQIASPNVNGNIKIWDTITYRLIHILNRNNNDNATVICYSPNSKRIASGHHSGFVRNWNTETGELINVLIGNQDKCINQICYSSDNHQIILGNQRHIIIWNIETDDGTACNQLVCTINNNIDVWSLCCFPDNKQIASGSYDNKIQIYDTETGERIDTLIVPTRDNNHLYVVSNNTNDLIKRIELINEINK